MTRGSKFSTALSFPFLASGKLPFHFQSLLECPHAVIYLLVNGVAQLPVDQHCTFNILRFLKPMGKFTDYYQLGWLVAWIVQIKEDVDDLGDRTYNFSYHTIWDTLKILTVL